MDISGFVEFEDAKRACEGVLRFSESVLSPVLRIEAIENSFKCELSGKRIIRGEAHLIKAESLDQLLPLA